VHFRPLDSPSLGTSSLTTTNYMYDDTTRGSSTEWHDASSIGVQCRQEISRDFTSKFFGQEKPTIEIWAGRKTTNNFPVLSSGVRGHSCPPQAVLRVYLYYRHILMLELFPRLLLHSHCLQGQVHQETENTRTR
jgi:hypothetical protein